MKDVFDLIEREEQRSKERQKMIEALQQNHWSENVILRNERDQRVLHEFLVEGKTLDEIAQWCGVTKERVRQIKDKGLVSLQMYLTRIAHEPPAKEMPYKEPVVIKEFGYNIYDIMARPDESRIDEVKQLLSSSVEDLDLSIRALNCIKGARLKLIGDLLQFSIDDLFKFKSFGKKSLMEIEAVLIERGIKFTRSSVNIEAYIENMKASKPGYAIKPKIQFTLPVSYPVLNFAWSHEIQLAFKEHNIITIAGLLMARELLAENTKLAPEHFEFIEHRLKEWGLKWK